MHQSVRHVSVPLVKTNFPDGFFKCSNHRCSAGVTGSCKAKTGIHKKWSTVSDGYTIKDTLSDGIISFALILESH